MPQQVHAVCLWQISSVGICQAWFFYSVHIGLVVESMSGNVEEIQKCKCISNIRLSSCGQCRYYTHTTVDYWILIICCPHLTKRAKFGHLGKYFVMLVHICTNTFIGDASAIFHADSVACDITKLWEILFTWQCLWLIHTSQWYITLRFKSNNSVIACRVNKTQWTYVTQTQVSIRDHSPNVQLLGNQKGPLSISKKRAVVWL